MSSFGYHKGIGDIYRGLIDLLSDNIRCGLLTNDYVPDQSGDEYLDDVSAYQPDYSGAVLLTNKSIISNDLSEVAALDADDITEWDDESFNGARYLLIYKDTGVASTSPLIALIDIGGVRKAPMTIQWNEGGIFGFSSNSQAFTIKDFENHKDPLWSDGWTGFGNVGWNKQNNPSIVPITSEPFDTSTSSWQKYVPCEVTTGPFGFDGGSGTSPYTTCGVSEDAKKEGARGYWADWDATTNGYNYVSLAAGSSQFVVSFWYNNHTFRLLNNNDYNAFGIINTSGLVNQVLWRIIRVSATSYVFRVYMVEDGGGTVTTDVLTFNPNDPPEWNLITIMGKVATGAGANDGTMFSYLNGSLVEAHEDIDNDTKDFQHFYLGNIGWAGSSQPTGLQYFDEIYFDDVGAMITSATRQMNGREYSMLSPVIGNSGNYVQNNISPAQTKVFIEFDWVRNPTNSYGGIARLGDGTHGRNLWYLQFVHPSQVRIVYDKDGTQNHVGSYFTLTEDHYTFAIYWQAASAPAADDGFIHFFVNGYLHETITGIDSDTLAANYTNYGALYNNGAVKHTFHIYGTMRVKLGPPGTSLVVKDWAASGLSGDYGLAAYVTPEMTSSSGADISFGDSEKQTIRFKININNLTLAPGEELDIQRLTDTTSARNTAQIAIDNSGGTYRLIFSYLEPGLGDSVIGTFNFPPSKICDIYFTFQKSTNGSVFDGYAFCYVNGNLVAYDDSIATYSLLVDLFTIGVSGPDSGTKGTYYVDDISYIANICLFRNPLNIDYGNAIYDFGDFSTDVVPDLEEKYFVALPFLSLVYTQTTVLTRPSIVTPGMAEYKVVLKNQEGDIVAEFDNWRSLAIARRVNTFGSCRFEIDGWDERASLFELDGQVEVWRRNKNVDLDWYLEWEGLHRTYNDLIQVNGKRSFVSFAVGYLHLLKRKHILWYASSPQASKSGTSGGVILAYVGENAGPAALQADGRVVDGVLPGLSIGTDLGYGNDWSGSRAWKNLFESVVSIADADNLYLDIIGVGDALFEFNVYEGQRGIDRTTQGIGSDGLNASGHAPTIFSTDFGNMELPNLAINRANEINRGFALGQGIETDRSIALTQFVDRMADSPWNEIEGTIQATNDGDDTNKLLIRAKEYAEANLYDETLSFNVLQTKSSFYGKHYNYGDSATFRYADIEVHKQIAGVKITVSENANGEKISIEVEDNIR